GAGRPFRGRLQRGDGGRGGALRQQQGERGDPAPGHHHRRWATPRRRLAGRPRAERCAMIAFACSSCRRTIRGPDALAGKKGKCPGCAPMVQVPDEPTPSSKTPTLSLPPAVEASGASPRSEAPTLAPEEVPPAASDSSVQIPGYEVLTEVGRGGMG